MMQRVKGRKGFPNFQTKLALEICGAALDVANIFVKLERSAFSSSREFADFEIVVARDDQGILISMIRHCDTASACENRPPLVGGIESRVDENIPHLRKKNYLDKRIEISLRSR